MANNKDFKVKNGIKPTVYHEGVGTVTSENVGYYLTNASYDGVTANTSSESTNARSVRFKTDGTKMYVLNGTGDAVYQYALSTAWDASTASYESKSFSTTSQETAPYGLFFKSDGTKMYIMGATDALYQYTLSTAWDVSTASYDSVSFSVASQHTAALGIYFSSDGNYFYIIGNTPDTVFQYNMSTAWDLSTASYSSNSFTHTQSTYPIAVAFNNDGTKMYIANGSSTYLVYQYSLSTAWDVSTASYDSISLDLAQSTQTLYSFTFGKDGEKLYTGYNGGGLIYQYSTALHIRTLDLSTGSVFEITPTFDTKISLSNPAASGTVSAATLLLDGVIAKSYDLVSASYDSVSFSVGSEESIPRDLFFKPDGTKMYICGSNGDEVNEYDLSTAWDVSTASFVQNFSVAGQDTNPSGLFFKPDGTKMYVTGYTGDDINEYNLSTAWDISTASYAQNFSVATEDTIPMSLFFKPDGAKMYIVGNAGDDINEYSLSTAWDISTASYVQNFSVNSEETFPAGVTFKSDGTKMYVVGTDFDNVNQYSLSTAWDISTASFDSITFSVASEEITPYGITFKSDGTKMYIAGATNDTVFQYSTGLIPTITYDTPIEFAGGTAPTSPAADETDILTFSTRNGGTSYQAVLAIDGAA